MPEFVRRRRALLASCALLALLGACAPTTGGGPMAPGGVGLTAGERGGAQFDSFLRMGDSARAAGDMGAALGFYRQAVASDASRALGHVRVGEALVALGAHDEAADAFRAALARDAGNLDARRGYARVLVGRNQPEAAIEHFRAVLERDARDLRALNGLAVAYDLAGRHEEAQATYQQGLALAPESTLIRNNYGLSLALAGDYDAAVSMLRELVNSPDATARNRQNLALVYGLAGDILAAEKVARIDLDEQAVRNNLEYYAMLRAAGNGRLITGALGSHLPDPPEGEEAVRASERLQVVALEGEGFELGLAPGGRWFLNLGQYRDSGQATQAWRSLQSRHGDLLGPLRRLAGVEQGGQPLLVGPLDSAEAAQQACSALQARGQSCRAVAL